MARPNRPTLVFPNGGENILARVIEISWHEPRPLSLDNLPVWYEIYYAEDYEALDEPDWKMLASIPSGISSFRWNIGNYLRSDRVRCAICSVNARGERSDFSVSADSFRIQREMPLTPAVLNPVPGGRYGSSIEIVLDDAAVRDNFGHRAKYYIYFSSQKAGVPLTIVAQRVPVGAGPLIWDTSLVKASDDYILTVYMADDDGHKSAEVNIRDIQIVNEGFFLIDTKPPSAYIRINDGAEFTKDPNVTVRIFAHDDTTGLHSMMFREGDVNISPESVVGLKYYRFKDGENGVKDGIKTLKALFQDFGGNRTSQSHQIFRLLFDLDNSDISDIILQKGTGTFWVACNSSQPMLFKIEEGSSFAVSINEPINALGILNSVVYLAVDTADDTALVYRYNGETLDEAIGISDSGSEIISMATYKQSLYLGSLNGALYKYSESSADLLRSFIAPIAKLYSDSSLLYILLKNYPNLIIYDGVNFSEVTI